MVWRRAVLLLVLLLVMGCAHTKGWTKQERQEMRRDVEVPTVAIETVPEESLPLPALQASERSPEERDEVAEARPAPEEKQEPAIVIVRSTPVVKMPEPTQQGGDLQYTTVVFEGSTQEYQPKRGDSVALVAKKNFPENQLVWVAGTFCHLNPKLMPECTEENFRTLPADKAWVFPAWEQGGSEQAVASETTPQSAVSGTSLDEGWVLEEVFDKVNMCFVQDTAPLVVQWQFPETVADPRLASRERGFWLIGVLVLALVTYLLGRRGRRRGDRRNLRWGS